MEYERTQCLNPDIISNLPQNVIESILSLMPLRDAVRTSVLSKKWRYGWRSMPKLSFTDDMVKRPSVWGHGLIKYKFVNAIFHVLMLHNGPTTLELNCRVGEVEIDSECDQIISYLATRNKVQEIYFVNYNSFYKLPTSFFSLQGLELAHLENCTFEPPLRFNGFSRLWSLAFVDVEVSAQMLQRFLSNCPLLGRLSLCGYQASDFAAAGNRFTFVDLLQLLPLIQTLEISKFYMKYLCAGGMHHKLPTSLDSLECLYLDVCLMEQTEISSVLCIIRSSTMLVHIGFMMYHNENLPIQQSVTNFLDPENHPDLNLVYLATLEITAFSNLPVEMEFVKLIMAKSPMLKKARIVLHPNVSVDEEVKMLRGLVLFPVPRASPSAKLIIERPQTSS